MRYWKPRPFRVYPLVGMVIATYHQTEPLRVLLSSLRNQSYPHFKILVVHDGPARDEDRAAFELGVWQGSVRQGEPDTRFAWLETPVRLNQFGHPGRVLGFHNPWLEDCTYLGTSNGDNYYAPVYLEWLLSELQKQSADIAYCDSVHSHKLWKPMPAQLRRGHIDVGQWLARAELVRETPWRNFSFAGDWLFLETLLKRCSKRVNVPATLFTHN